MSPTFSLVRFWSLLGRKLSPKGAFWKKMKIGNGTQNQLFIIGRRWDTLKTVTGSGFEKTLKIDEKTIGNQWFLMVFCMISIELPSKNTIKCGTSAFRRARDHAQNSAGIPTTAQRRGQATYREEPHEFVLFVQGLRKETDERAEVNALQDATNHERTRDHEVTSHEAATGKRLPATAERPCHLRNGQS